MKPNEESTISINATGFGNYDLPGLGVQQLGILFQVVFLYHQNINAPYEWGFIVALN